MEPGRFPQPPTGDPGASLASRYDDDLGDAVAYPTTSDRESGWFRGTGGAGTVHVRIDRTTTDARVELHRGWRAAVGPQLLAPAVLEALHGASFARFADLQRLSTETIAQVRSWLATAGDPIALELVATGWIEEVAGPVSALVPLGAAERPELTSSWSGDAAEAYVAVLPAQGTALQAIQDTAGDVRMVLTEFANAIRAFWSGIDNAVIAAGVGLDAAVGAAATGVGAIAGIALAFGAIAACGTSIGQEIAALSSFTAATTSQSGALVTRLDNNAGFGDAVWPRSTTDLFSDGSITDGDPTDWHVG